MKLIKKYSWHMEMDLNHKLNLVNFNFSNIKNQIVIITYHWNRICYINYTFLYDWVDYPLVNY